MMRILGIDPSIRGTGFGIIDLKKTNICSVIVSGTIKVPAKIPQSQALAQVSNALETLIREHQPDEAAIEKIIYVQSIRTAITMGSARGAALTALGKFKITVTEYPAKTIKSAVTGTGGAQKDQVAFMIRALLGMDRTPDPDEGDALAIAITHARRLKAVS
ncbi:MAG: crossover junction endodeoxyribonuclease RuvC [Verrucomicrobiota bacterium]